MTKLTEKNHKEDGPRTWVLGMEALLVMTLLALPSTAAMLKTYEIEPGDTLTLVAERFGVPVQELARANELKARTPLVAGRKLKIPAVLSELPNRVHQVEPGEDLERLSIQYDVSIEALSLANRLAERGYELSPGQELIIPLEDGQSNPVWRPQPVPMPIRSGRVVVGGVSHVVQPGQTLSDIAVAYDLPVETLAEANELSVDAALVIRSELFIPGASEVREVMADGCAYRAVHFVRSHNGQQVTLPLLTCSGDIVPKSRVILSTIASPDPGRAPKKLLSTELIRKLQDVADHFPGRSIEVVSGYRPTKRKGKSNPHSLAQAIDFNVSGVPRKKVFEFLKTLTGVGAGYYPNSVFVHLDVRSETTFWIDQSGVGEPADYSAVALAHR